MKIDISGENVDNRSLQSFIAGGDGDRRAIRSIRTDVQLAVTVQSVVACGDFKRAAFHIQNGFGIYRIVDRGIYRKRKFADGEGCIALCLGGGAGLDSVLAVCLENQFAGSAENYLRAVLALDDSIFRCRIGACVVAGHCFGITAFGVIVFRTGIVTPVVVGLRIGIVTPVIVGLRIGECVYGSGGRFDGDLCTLGTDYRSGGLGGECQAVQHKDNAGGAFLHLHAAVFAAAGQKIGTCGSDGKGGAVDGKSRAVRCGDAIVGEADADAVFCGIRGCSRSGRIGITVFGVGGSICFR